MSYIMVVNKTRLPLHGALSWAGIQQQCFNDLQPGASHDFVVGLGWHDLTVVVGGKDNRFDEANNNKIDFGRLALDVVRLVVLMGGPVGIAFPFGNPNLSKLSLAAGQPQPGGVKLAGLPLEFRPVQVTELYAPDGYTIDVNGGDVDGVYDEALHTFTITKVTPLALEWRNRNTSNSGKVVATAAG